ncbi:hypothetical protein BST86_01685 [Nonlabens agnitus]|uniref:Uncharacterized protein n=2 Tax=Nonlabens agnitus TaxID=870484 RepID=A0A2S9WQX5_9FLAO|nr:hypothetical protein BST86_01685 [Nonlabens agnitus]
MTTTAMAQGPNAPEAASFEPVDATDMVNLVTGDLSYVLPLLNVPSPEGGYPIALSYHAGIAMDQEASWVGLGWNINPGAINRSVNGKPDDWKGGKEINIVYADLGETENITVGLGAGIKGLGSAAIDYTFVDGKGMGGMVSMSSQFGRYSVGYGQYAGQNSLGINLMSLSGSLGNSGLGASANLGYDILNNKPYLRLSISHSSTESSLSTGSNGTSTAIGGVGVSMSITNSIQKNDYSVRSKGFSIIIPYKFLTLKLTYAKTRVSLFDNQERSFYGSLYSKDAMILSNGSNQNINLASKDRFMDVSGAKVGGTKSSSEEIVYGNPQSLSYDNYRVSGQGNMMSIQPRYYEFGALNGVQETSYQYGKDNAYQTLPFTKSFSDTNKNLFFYNTEFASSYLKVSSDDWLVHNSLNDILDTMPASHIETVSNFNNGESDQGRRRSGEFIESYTNDQIINNGSLIIEATNFNRSALVNSSQKPKYPPEGIGAFKITSVDGKTYHYSLPVYHYEYFRKSYDLNKGEFEEFAEVKNLKPYATHWLLTSITGPDYIDANGNGILDKGDFGYWVNFNYGKWCNSFLYEELISVKERYTRTTVKRFDEERKNAVKIQGIKELYYLNSIVTRDHSALFIKSKRLDNIGASDSRNETYDDVNKTLVDDDASIATGIYFEDIEYNIETLLTAVPTLKLDKILLIKNEHASLVALNHIMEPINSVDNYVKINTYSERFNAAGQHLGTYHKINHDRNWKSGTIENNVYLSKNMPANFESNHMLKGFLFNYDYSLARRVDQSTAKLTLEKLTTLSKNTTSVVPPYHFSYYSENRLYDHKDYDLWGFYKTDPKVYSLRTIESPLGDIVDIEYERDDFHNILFAENKINDLTPVPTSLKFLNSGSKVELDIRNTNPCIEIDEFYSCMKINQSITLVLKKSNYPDLNVTGSLKSINRSESKIVVDLPITLDSHYNTNFYNNVYRNGSSGYVVDLIIPDCNTNQQIGKCNDSRGGLRVKSINIINGTDRISTLFDYNFPGTEVSSGVTTYTPYLRFPSFASLVPGPGVIYKNVEVSQIASNNDFLNKMAYKFNTFKPLDYKIGQSVPASRSTPGYALEEIEGFLTINYDNNYSVPNIPNYDTSPNQVYTSKLEIFDNFHMLGSLLEQSSINSENQILEKSIYNYGVDVNEIGLSKESFNSYSIDISEVQSPNSGTKFANFYLGITSKTRIPSKLKSIESSTNNYSSLSYNTKYDFNTGLVLETETVDSRGNRFKTESVPAYKIAEYNPVGGYGMGSKVDDITNKNMLSQQAMSKTYLDVGGTWKLTSADITTWNNNWRYPVSNPNASYEQPTDPAQKIWRKHKSYVWDGQLNTDDTDDAYGTYVNFTGEYDGFNWGLGGYTTDGKGNTVHAITHGAGSNWKLASETTLYNHFSAPLEARDINGNHASTKYDKNYEKVISTVNAAYTEQYYSGAEDEANGLVGGHMNIWYHQDAQAHTGKYSENAGTGSKNFRSYPRPVLKATESSKRFRVSVWAHKANHGNARISVGGNLTQFSGEKVFAGDWVQLNHYFDLSGQTEVFVRSASGTVYFDDFRLHPVGSSMSSYVYNEWGELSYILGANNMATHYEYDDAGRLVRTYVETADNGTVAGGFKLAKEMDYRYKASMTFTGPPAPRNPLRAVKEPSGIVNACVEAPLTGGGQTANYQYKWAQSSNPSNLVYGNWTTDLCLQLNIQSCKSTFYKVAIRNVDTGVTKEWSGSYFNNDGCPPTDPGGGGPVLIPDGGDPSNPGFESPVDRFN